ncbi:MAG: hypothetical protein JO263_04135 [Candidatus Eremiobacteraeota bacterium]|nr:hypothetical protein [Candidatus Eremiobacteraeota bacterium]
MRFTEEVFSLAPLGTIDARADNLADCFNFAQAPAAYRPVQTTVRADYFLRQQPSARPPDD